MTNNKKTTDDIKVEINKLIVKRDELIIKVADIDKEIKEKTLEYYKASPLHIKIQCPTCKGKGFTQQDERKKVCQSCNGREYIWMIKYEK